MDLFKSWGQPCVNVLIVAHLYQGDLLVVFGARKKVLHLAIIRIYLILAYAYWVDLLALSFVLF